MSLLLYIAKAIIYCAVGALKDDEDISEDLTEICLSILRKCVKLTKTKVDDKLLEIVMDALKPQTSDIVFVEK